MSFAPGWQLAVPGPVRGSLERCKGVRVILSWDVCFRGIPSISDAQTQKHRRVRVSVCQP